MSDLTKYIPDPDNANAGNDDGRGLLKKSVERLGAGRSILVDADGVVIAGNKTLEAAKAAGLVKTVEVETDGNTLVVVKRTDLHLTGDDESSRKARQLAFADNRAGEVGLTWIPEKIMAADVQGIDLGWLFDKRSVSDLTNNADSNASNQAQEHERMRMRNEKRDAERQEIANKWEVEPGDLWELGPHRLFCGNCTNDLAIDTVMAGRQADYTFTSPPYGIGLEYESGQGLDALRLLVRDCINQINRISTPEAYATMNYADVYESGSPGFTPVSGFYEAPFAKHGWWLRGNRVWFKPFQRLGIAFGSRTTINLREWEYVRTWRRSDGPEELLDHTGITLRGVWASFGPDAIIDDWEKFDSTTDKGLHPAAFPIILPIAGLRAYTQLGAHVYEPFAGSGTTLFACQHLGRICHAVELDPVYCALILEEYQNAFGVKPKRISHDPFDEEE